MTKNVLLLCAASLLTGFASCIKDEALNAECDIVGVDPAWVSGKLSEGILIGEPVVRNDRVDFTVKLGSDRTALNPVFELTPGSTIFPESGTVRDFSGPQTYTTRSEDGAYSKEYTVSFKYPSLIRNLNFEHFALNSRSQYYQWFEVGNTPDDRFDYWDSGNGGYAFTGMARTPEDYPTTPWPAGRRGNCIRLKTLSTGSWGRGVGMPIAAGNLFIGEFKVAQAMLKPRQATRFGRQLVTARPLRFEGWYRYTAGEHYQNIKEQILPGERDTCDIYAVLYEVDPTDFKALNGDDVLTSDRIVLMARIDKPGEPQEWTRFSEPFRPVGGRAFDYSRLATDGYAIAVVCTSSRQGAYFEGAIGSELFVDELRIVWEGDDEHEED